MTDQVETVPFALPDITEAEVSAVVNAMRSGWLTTGPNSKAFENEFASSLGGDLETVAVNSATSGLHLALDALGLGVGDEVLVPTWTFTATAEVVRYVGATPVFIDVDPVTLNIDLEAAERAVTPNTRAIIPVHFAGLPVPALLLHQFAQRHDIRVIEDAAHAFPVRSDGSYVGNGRSDGVVFSFYATKTITTGEGGMLVTGDHGLANRARIMRLHGISHDAFDRYRSSTPRWKYEVIAPGFKYNLTDIAAAVGRVQLSRATQMGNARARIAARYTGEFSQLPLQLPAGPSEWGGHAWHLFTIRLLNDAPMGRDEFIDSMARAGVVASVHFIPLHLQPYWRSAYGLRVGNYPVATEASSRIVSLPIYSAMTDRQIDRVVELVTRLLGA